MSDEDSAAPLLPDIAPPPLTSGITGALSNLAAPPTLFVSADDVVPTRRSHRRVAPPGDALTPSFAYSSTINTIAKEATAAVQDSALKGELTVPATITEEEVDVLDADTDVLHRQIAELKRSLNIKMRRYEAKQAQLRVARKVLSERQKREREERMAALRERRAALLRQQSEEEAAVRPAPEKDLTREGIEPNP